MKSENKKMGIEKLTTILDRPTNLVDPVTKVPITIGQLLFHPEYRDAYPQLVEIARNAEPIGPFSKRLGFTRRLDQLYDSGDKVLGTYWQELKKAIGGTEDEAYDILVESGEFPELVEKYRGS